LLVIRTAGHVAVIIGYRIIICAAIRSECNSKTTIVVNGVSENGPSGVIASEAGDADAVEDIECDDVAFPCIHAADRPGGRVASANAAVSVAQRRAVNVGADFVALDNYPCRATADVNAVGARIYYVSCTRCVATDGRVD
jgi:hypothetical protein